MYIEIRAEQLQVGDVLVRTPQRGPISVKKVTEMTNPLTRRKEIKIRGPLNIIEKYDAKAAVRLIHRANARR